MFAWVETFDLIWFTYSNLPEAKPDSADITINGTLLTYQKTLQTTTTIQDIGEPRYMCYRKLKRGPPTSGYTTPKKILRSTNVPLWTA